MKLSRNPRHVLIFFIFFFSRFGLHFVNGSFRFIIGFLFFFFLFSFFLFHCKEQYCSYTINHPIQSNPIQSNLSLSLSLSAPTLCRLHSHVYIVLVIEQKTKTHRLSACPLSGSARGKEIILYLMLRSAEGNRLIPLGQISVCIPQDLSVGADW